MATMRKVTFSRIVFAILRIREMLRISNDPWLWTVRMVYEPYLCDLPVLRKRPDRNNNNKKNNGKNNRTAQAVLIKIGL